MPEDLIVTKRICPRCQGTRRVSDSACPKCGGTGAIHSTMSLKEMTERVQKEMSSGTGR